MKKTVSLSTLLVVDVVAFAIVWLMPPVPAGVPVRRIFLVILAAAFQMENMMPSLVLKTMYRQNQVY